MVIRLTMLYEVKCLPAKNLHIQKMKTTKLRMLRWMCKHNARDKIRNENSKAGLAVVVDKMHEAILI